MIKENEINKVLVIGLDSAPPELLFGKFLDSLPNIKKSLKNQCMDL